MHTTPGGGSPFTIRHKPAGGKWEETGGGSLRPGAQRPQKMFRSRLGPKAVDLHWGLGRSYWGAG